MLFFFLQRIAGLRQICHIHVLSAIEGKIAEWKQRKEAILSGEVNPSMATGEDVNIYKVQEEVGTSVSLEDNFGCVCVEVLCFTFVPVKKGIHSLLY